MQSICPTQSNPKSPVFLTRMFQCCFFSLVLGCWVNNLQNDTKRNVSSRETWSEEELERPWVFLSFTEDCRMSTLSEVVDSVQKSVVKTSSACFVTWLLMLGMWHLQQNSKVSIKKSKNTDFAKAPNRSCEIQSPPTLISLQLGLQLTGKFLLHFFETGLS